VENQRKHFGDRAFLRQVNYLLRLIFLPIKSNIWGREESHGPVAFEYPSIIMVFTISGVVFVFNESIMVRPWS
jgi:hypothetical protein